MVFSRPVQPFCLTISHETHGFDESLVIQHEMADFCTLIIKGEKCKKHASEQGASFSIVWPMNRS